MRRRTARVGTLLAAAMVGGCSGSAPPGGSSPGGVPAAGAAGASGTAGGTGSGARSTATGAAPDGAVPTAAGGPAARAALQAAVKGTRAAGSARLAFTLDHAALGETTSGRGEGAVDFAGRDVQLVPTEPTSSGEVRRIDGTYYARFQQEPDDAFPDEKTWVRLSRQDVRAGSTDPGPAILLQPVDGVDPQQLLTVAAEHAPEPRLVGAEAVSGTPTAHYRAGVRVDGDPEPGAVPALLLPAEDGEAPEGTLDLWIDSARVHRVELSVRQRVREGAPPGEGAAPGEATVEQVTSVREDLTDFGAPVRIEAPPAGAVMTAAQLAAYEERAGDEASGG